MSDEEATLWTSQAITGEMNFTSAQLTLAENQQIALKPYCKWKAPAPSNRDLTFTVGTPGVISVSDDGTTLTTIGLGSTTLTATTADGYSSTMIVSVKEVQELVDVTQSTWGSSITTTYSVGWIFKNNTVVDLTVTRAAMLVLNTETGNYEENGIYADGLNLLARSNNGTATGTLKLREENVKQLPSSMLRISYVYNGKTYTVDIPFTNL